MAWVTSGVNRHQTDAETAGSRENSRKEHQPEPEVRDRDAADCRHHEQAIGPAAIPGGGEKAQRHADTDRDQEARGGQREGVGQPCQQERHHRLAAEDRPAQVTPQDMSHVVEILHPERQIEAERVAHPCDLLRRRR
jgi:hypothetical protein